MKLLIDLAFKALTAFSVTKAKIGTYILREHIRYHAASYGSLHLNGWGQFSGISGLVIGNNVHLGISARWACEGGITVGDNTHFSRFVTIYSRNHNYEGKRLPYDNTYIFKEVLIGKNVWVGSDVIILPGTVIGDGAVIGAGSIVSGNVPAGALWGMKAGLIGQRDAEHYDHLEAKRFYGGVNGKKI